MSKASESPTKVIFIWHMHQPFYRVPHKNNYTLPWVRLHAIKDYWGMAKTVEKFDKVKVTFNFSGVLLQQLLDHINNGAQDYYGKLSLRNPAHLKKEEKDFIIDRFFSINFDRHIKPHRRYLQLYNKKLSPKPRFSAQDIQDLQALFNLLWLHPYCFQTDKHLKKLFLKEKNYTRVDIEYILKMHYKIMGEIPALYKTLLAHKRIELTLTPHYHPIMPLLFDSDIVKEFPYLKKPLLRFTAPNECRWHLHHARQTFRTAFDYEPLGSWPSEGSVSEDVVSLYGREGFKWIGADEAILFKSLTTENVSFDMIKNQRHMIYRPYSFDGTNIFFRDRNFSDMISFTYQGWDDSAFAAGDLIEHFKRTHNYTKNIYKDRAITIIMDGENAWEYYPDNGVTFLESTYERLEESPVLTTTTPLEFLENNPGRRLERLSAGSWINADFGVWVGNKANNTYWHILRNIRDAMAKAAIEEKRMIKIKEYLHIIEGSDWFWWNTFHDTTDSFKKIFCAYVEEIYSLLDKPLPPNAACVKASITA
jgi:alpha-amylase/alpha-mannosidase (GH57 family)